MTTDWYEYPYNYSNGTQSVNGFGDFINYITFTTNNGLVLGFLAIIWMSTFVFGLASGARKGLAVASFITFMLSIYFVRMGSINILIPITLIILTIIGLLGGSKDDQSL
jgi:hypothetical protein